MTSFIGSEFTSSRRRFRDRQSLRRAQVVALAPRNSQLAEEGKFFGVLDTFGDEGPADVERERYKRRGQRASARIAGDPGYEAAIEFDDVWAEAYEKRQPRVSRSSVVDGDPDTPASEVVEPLENG